MGQLDKKIFGKKKFSDILEEIYLNQKKKEAQISTLISELKPLIQDIGDATLIVPLLKEYLEISVKNDILGKPKIIIKGKSLRIVLKILNTKKFYTYLSLSDEDKYAIATILTAI